MIHTDASALKYLTTMKNHSGLFTRWYQELAGFNFTVIHKKGKENSNMDALSRSSHMEDALPLEDDVYAEFYDVDEPVIKFLEGINKIQHVQWNLGETAEEQAKNKVWSEVISWVEKGLLPNKAETWGKTKEVLAACSIFDPSVFKMRDGVLMFTKSANRHQSGEVGRICIQDSMIKEVWSLCHQSNLGGHRGLEGTLNKFLRGFFMFSARPKLRYLNEGCDICIVKERTMPV